MAETTIYQQNYQTSGNKGTHTYTPWAGNVQNNEMPVQCNTDRLYKPIPLSETVVSIRQFSASATVTDTQSK